MVLQELDLEGWRELQIASRLKFSGLTLLFDWILTDYN